MESNAPQPDLHQDCLDKLNQVLDLAMKTAAAASAEGNHKVVIQAAREVTRIVTLIHKMSLVPEPKPKPKPQTAPVSLAGLVKQGIGAPPAFNGPRAVSPGSLFQPGALGDLDDLSFGLLQDISRNWAELTSLTEAAQRSPQESVAGESAVNPPSTQSRLTKLFGRKQKKAKGKR